MMDNHSDNDKINHNNDNDDDDDKQDCHCEDFDFGFDFHQEKSPLNMKLVCDSFRNSIKDKSEIDLSYYLSAYTELIKFFQLFGTIFSFVTSDVIAKIDILESYSNDEKIGHNYRTLSSMIEYERNENLLKDSKRPSGSRTLLRLHRALEFLSKFLNELSKLDDDECTAKAVRQSYETTLAKHHSWIIKKSVHIATLVLPYRNVLIQRFYGGQLPIGGADKVNESISYLANITDQVFKVTQKLYSENELLDLP